MIARTRRFSDMVRRSKQRSTRVRRPRKSWVASFSVKWCSVQSQASHPKNPLSPSGHIYERRLIKKYIAENGTDPITGDKLEESDLVELNVCSCSLWLDIVQGELTQVKHQKPRHLGHQHIPPYLLSSTLCRTNTMQSFWSFSH